MTFSRSYHSSSWDITDKGNNLYYYASSEKLKTNFIKAKGFVNKLVLKKIDIIMVRIPITYTNDERRRIFQFSKISNNNPKLAKRTFGQINAGNTNVDLNRASNFLNSQILKYFQPLSKYESMNPWAFLPRERFHEEF